MQQNDIVETTNATIIESEEGDRRVNQYKFIRSIGRGAFGIVHLAYDEVQQKNVAIKEFSKLKLRKTKFIKLGARLKSGSLRLSRPPNYSPSSPVIAPTNSASIANSDSIGSTVSVNSFIENPLDLVRGEIAILKKLHHPHVVQLFEVLDSPQQDSLFMVYELCERGSLLDVSRLSDECDTDGSRMWGVYTQDETRDYFGQLVLGIEYLHANDIVHRDIKPDNLLLDRNGVLKIADFGVSEMFMPGSDLTRQSAGSPAFFSPEMCTSGHGEISAKAADIWAVGVTLYALVFCQLPFHGESIVLLYENIKNALIVFPDGLCQQLKHLLSSILEKDPAKRYTIEQIRQHPWLTQNGKTPLLSREANLAGSVQEITEHELSCAITPIRTFMTVLKAVGKFKAHSHHTNHDRSASSESSSSSSLRFDSKSKDS